MQLLHVTKQITDMAEMASVKLRPGYYIQQFAAGLLVMCVTGCMCSLFHFPEMIMFGTGVAFVNMRNAAAAGPITAQSSGH